jgi:hypothetical protein
VAVWGVGLDRLDAEIVGSNPTQGMDVRSRLSVLYYPAHVEVFQTTRTRKSCRVYKYFKDSVVRSLQGL